jgi:hypothetical protein
VIFFIVVLAVLGGVMLSVALLSAVDRHRERAELVRIHRVARSAEWRLQRLGQEACFEMLVAALLATPRQQPESSS